MHYNRIINLILIFSILGIGMVSCEKSDNEDVNISYTTFPKSQKLSGTIRTIDRDDVYIPGKIAVTDNGYMVFLYDSDHFISVLDKNFKEISVIAPKGEGPGEVVGVSGTFGQKLDKNGLLSVYDSYKFKLYGYNPESGKSLQEVISFPSDFSSYAPINVIKLANGCYVSPRGDFKYGMIMYNPSNSETSLWPIGIADINEQNPDYSVVSLRDVDYSEKNGIIAEIYGSTPIVILHNEDGKIVRTIKIEGIDATNKDDNRLSDVFKNVVLTDKYIWLLYGDSDLSQENHVLVLSYDGTPIADYIIQSTSEIDVDYTNKLLIAVDPNNEDANIMTYEFE
jgi:hypothetical protein